MKNWWKLMENWWKVMKKWCKMWKSHGKVMKSQEMSVIWQANDCHWTNGVYKYCILQDLNPRNFYVDVSFRNFIACPSKIQQDSRIWFLNIYIFVLCDWNQTLLTLATKSPTVLVVLAWAESLLHVSTSLSCPATLLHGHDPALSVLLCGIKRGACKGTPTHNISKLSLYPSFGVRHVSNLEPYT